MYEYHRWSKNDKFLRKAIYEAYGQKCARCGIPITAYSDIQIDHIYPAKAPTSDDEAINLFLDELREDGFDTEHPDYIENYRLLCGNCNRQKSNKLLEASSYRELFQKSKEKTPDILNLIDKYKKHFPTDIDNFLRLDSDGLVVPEAISISTESFDKLNPKFHSTLNRSQIEQSYNVQQNYPRVSAKDDSYTEKEAKPCDISPNTILYSVGTNLAYFINQNYYKNKHYLWCTTSFFDSNQPPTSDPQTIAKRLIQIIKTRDHHAHEIEDNISGLLRGVAAKQKQSVIDKNRADMLKGFIDCIKVDYSQFYPVLYVIPVSRLNDYESRCKPVDKKDRASDLSKEYIIDDLDLNLEECDVIFFKDILSDSR